jgi:hypothetical protein
MPEYDVAEELQAYLVAQNVGVLPADSDGTKTVVILQPRDGAPQPLKDGSGRFGLASTVTLNIILASRPNDLDYAIEETFIDVIVRARQNAAAKLLLRTIRGLLVPGDAVGGRRMWQMGAINPVECCLLWRGAQPISADEHSYDWSQSFMFQVRRKTLAGLPYGTP